MAEDLGDLLAKVLPAGVEITVRHVSSTPTPSAALFAPAPGDAAEPTFCENHFLSVSIESPDDGGEIIVFGIEVLVYNTAHLTTIFVSKADSTGLLHLLKVPQKVSVLRLVSNTFLSFLARTRQRPGVRLVISLFARAQDQYLFPGSIENAEKHVLDDRGLIKWWCRAVDPILREHEAESVSTETKPLDETVEATKASATAYLVVPGCEPFETRSLFPITAKADTPSHRRWLSSYPLHQLCHDPSAPPRCLIPRLPDDPKTRFLVDLDDELPEPVEGEALSPNAGQWRSVRTLDQFWEMMSFRQECSSGRLVGFLWLVINPPGLMNSTSMASQARPSTQTVPPSKDTDVSMATPDEEQSQKTSSKTEEPDASEKKEPATEASSESRADTTSSFDTHPGVSSVDLPSKGQSNDANPFSWPQTGRGHMVLSDADYNKMMNSLMDHFYDQKDVVASTKAHIDQVASLADQLIWGKRVVGTSTLAETSAPRSTETHKVLDLGLIRKRKKSTSEDNSSATDGAQPLPSAPGDTAQPAGVNMLNANLVRKKKKT